MSVVVVNAYKCDHCKNIALGPWLELVRLGWQQSLSRPRLNALGRMRPRRSVHFCESDWLEAESHRLKLLDDR